MLRVNDFQDNIDTNGTYGGNNGSTDDLLVCFSTSIHPELFSKTVFLKFLENFLKSALVGICLQ